VPVLIHSAAIDNTTYDQGKFPLSGERSEMMIDYHSQPGHQTSSVFLLSCSSGTAYYIEKGKPCDFYPVKTRTMPCHVSRCRSPSRRYTA
jgi:hypothetical protein